MGTDEVEADLTNQPSSSHRWAWRTIRPRFTHQGKSQQHSRQPYSAQRGPKLGLQWLFTAEVAKHTPLALLQISWKANSALFSIGSLAWQTQSVEQERRNKKGESMLELVPLEKNCLSSRIKTTALQKLFALKLSILGCVNASNVERLLWSVLIPMINDNH